MDFFAQDQLVGWLIAMTFAIVLGYAVWQLMRVQKRKRGHEATRMAADRITPSDTGINRRT